MRPQQQPTTEDSIRVLNDDINNVAVKANVEREVLAKYGFDAAANSIGDLMRLVWKLFRACKALQATNTRLRNEAMETRELNKRTAAMNFVPVSKDRIN